MILYPIRRLFSTNEIARKGLAFAGGGAGWRNNDYLKFKHELTLRQAAGQSFLTSLRVRTRLWTMGSHLTGLNSAVMQMGR